MQYSLDEDLEENSYISVVDFLSHESPEKSREPLLESEVVPESYSMTRMAEKIRHLEELLPITSSGTERHKKCLRLLTR